MLTKKDKKKRYNKKAKTSSTHVFDAWGDRYDSKFMKNSANTAQEVLIGSNLGGSIAGIAGGIGGIVEAGMANAQIADTTEQEQEREARENWQSSANDNNSLLAEMASDVSISENTNWKSIRGVTPGQMVGNTLKGVVSGASAGTKVGGPFGAIAGAVVGLGSSIGGIFAGRAKAQKKAGELNEAAKKANLAKAQTLTSKAGALDQAADQRALAAYAAYGGDINTPKFPDFPSEITEFNAGGSHEENPYDGIPQGIAPDGLPNLVEEGEVKYDNYIFSDRLMLNKNDKKKYKFLKGKTYADAAKAIKKQLGVDERPNDLLAKTDLEEQLNLLSMLQEEERAKKGLRGENKMMYATGGHLFPGTRDTLTGYDLSDDEEYVYDDMYPIWEDPHYVSMYEEDDMLPTRPVLTSVTPISPKDIADARISPNTRAREAVKQYYDMHPIWEDPHYESMYLENDMLPSKPIFPPAASISKNDIANAKIPRINQPINGYEFFDNEEDAAKAGMDWNPPTPQVGEVANASTYNQIPKVDNSEKVIKAENSKPQSTQVRSMLGDYSSAVKFYNQIPKTVHSKPQSGNSQITKAKTNKPQPQPQPGLGPMIGNVSPSTTPSPAIWNSLPLKAGDSLLGNFSSAVKSHNQYKAKNSKSQPGNSQIPKTGPSQSWSMFGTFLNDRNMILGDQAQIAGAENKMYQIRPLTPASLDLSNRPNNTSNRVASRTNSQNLYVDKNGNVIPSADGKTTGITSNGQNNNASSTSSNENQNGSRASFLRAAPAIGSAIGLMSNLFDKPTYEHTNKLTQPESPVTPMSYTPTHQDIRLDRFDTNYHANKLAAQAGATRRAIREQTASNPYASTAALLSADANAQSQMGDLYRKAAEYNQGLALQEAQFNSAGRRADAEGLFKAASANATLQDKALSRQAEKDAMAARLNMAEDQAWDTANSANITSLFDNLGAIGREDRTNSLVSINNLWKAGQVEAAEQLGKQIYGPNFSLDRTPIVSNTKKYGGKLRKKKGYTI